MNGDIERVVEDLIARAGRKTRFLVAIAGPPGSGKSTFVEQLAEALRARGEQTAIVPMDGFHLDDAVLREKGLLERKGAPETFDVRGFVDIVRALQDADGEVFVPVFDRSRELAIAAARSVSPRHRFVLVEGNYLLLDQSPWTRLAGLLDVSIMLQASTGVLNHRLMERWRALGLSEEAVRAKVMENDMPNGELVRSRSRRADITLS
jgi:pantothenate kinase